MPEQLQRSAHSGNGPSPARSLSSSAIWSNGAKITFDQLHKFWSEMPLEERQKLLRVDKQTLFEQARKNFYCSRCNGLLLEGFSQIVMYGKSLQQEAAWACRRRTGGESDDMHYPSVHPWGGLAATRDGMLTLLDGFINAKSLMALQNVFDNARVRERERELLYPDACGGGARGWISHGMTHYGRGFGVRETCAVHTARFSCDTLVDFWSALSDETRLSLLRMKEDDFIERLTRRFDQKRFCRDCRRNVIHELKDLKDPKRMRRGTRCTSWFCVADTAFDYEVLEDTILADWHQCFTDTIESYHHFEWAIGTGEGKSDILEFEDVGMNRKAQVNGLDLGDLSACFITLRAWKLDGRCTELYVKAHALKGKPCVHQRIVVGDGYVTITKGESIRRFFEHAEEAEEEEESAMDKDGNEFDGDGSRPQKHAKSPELARDFLLDSATVFFKEQVEKAFREGTARQNAHSIFVCLALKLLEERILVACKEIITLEKQNRLLEEEEREKQEEQEKRERRRTKEREKKLRRKERLKGKERERERKYTDTDLFNWATSNNESSTSTHDDALNSIDSGDSISETRDTAVQTSPAHPHYSTKQLVDEYADTNNVKSISLQFLDGGDFSYRDGSDAFVLKESQSSRTKLRFTSDSLLDPSSKLHGKHRQSRGRVVKTDSRNCSIKFSGKYHCSNSGARERYNSQSFSCNLQGDRRAKDGFHNSKIRSGREVKCTNKTESSPDMPRPLFRSTKYNQGCLVQDSCVISKRKPVAGATGSANIHKKQVWEPTDPRKKGTRSNSGRDITSKSCAGADSPEEVGFEKIKNMREQPHIVPVSSDDQCLTMPSGNTSKRKSSSRSDGIDDSKKNSGISYPSTISACHNGIVPITKSACYSKDDVGEELDSCSIVPGVHTGNDCDPIMSLSNSDNCSSCSTSSSSVQNAESSSTSDSEDASQQLEERFVQTCKGNGFHTFTDNTSDSKTVEKVPFIRIGTGFPESSCVGSTFLKEEALNAVSNLGNNRSGIDLASSQQHMPLVHNRGMHVKMFKPPTSSSHSQNVGSWSAVPTSRLVPFSWPNHYVFPSPYGYHLAASQSSDFCMQYNTVQPLTPSLSLRQHSSYGNSDNLYVADSNEQIKNINESGEKQIRGASKLTQIAHSHERLYPNKLSSKQQSAGQIGNVGHAAIQNDVIQSFSLFHFGGPVAGAAGYNVNSLSSKEGNGGGLVSTSPLSEANTTCSKEETKMEEYSLFSSSNGARFPFF